MIHKTIIFATIIGLKTHIANTYLKKSENIFKKYYFVCSKKIIINKPKSECLFDKYMHACVTIGKNSACQNKRDEVI